MATYEREELMTARFRHPNEGESLNAFSNVTSPAFLALDEQLKRVSAQNMHDSVGRTVRILQALRDFESHCTRQAKYLPPEQIEALRFGTEGGVAPKFIDAASTLAEKQYIAPVFFADLPWSRTGGYLSDGSADREYRHILRVDDTYNGKSLTEELSIGLAYKGTAWITLHGQISSNGDIGRDIKIRCAADKYANGSASMLILYEDEYLMGPTLGGVFSADKAAIEADRQELLNDNFPTVYEAKREILNSGFETIWATIKGMATFGVFPEGKGIDRLLTNNR